ncbi:MAG: Ig-like domain-containing protein [Gammaproteobacteria bacterium]
MRLLPLFLFAWLILCGSTFVSCSSGSRNGLFDPFDPGPGNRAPRAIDSSTVATVNLPISGFMQAVDDDGDRLFFRVVAAPSLGNLRIDNTASGSFTYTGVLTGTDRFSFQVDDGLANSNVATVTIQVTPMTLAYSRHVELRNNR